MANQLTQTQIVQSQEVKKGVDGQSNVTFIKTAAYTAIVGSVCFIIGAILWGSTGTDLDLAVTNGNMAGYLTAAGSAKPVLVANLSFWIVGALILGVAGATMANLSERRGLAQVALVCYRTAVPLVIVSYVAMLAVVVQIAPDTSETAVYLAEVVGWIGSRADWVATILMIGAGPLFLTLSARGTWMPNWLVGLGYVAGFCGLLTLLSLFIETLATVGFLTIPVGLIWMIATGAVLLRQNKTMGS